MLLTAVRMRSQGHARTSKQASRHRSSLPLSLAHQSYSGLAGRPRTLPRAKQAVVDVTGEPVRTVEPKSPSLHLLHTR